MTSTNQADLIKITEALQLLDQRISENELLDPGLFAEDVHDQLAGAHDEWLGTICPGESVETHKALADFRRDYPDIANGGLNSLWTHQETMLSYALALYNAGLRHGAAYEHLRRAVIGEVTECRTCWGFGLTKQGDTCPSCVGTGTVATGTQSGR